MLRYFFFALFFFSTFSFCASYIDYSLYANLSPKEILSKADSLQEIDAEESLHYYDIYIKFKPNNYNTEESIDYLRVCKRLIIHYYYQGNNSMAFGLILEAITLSEEKKIDSYLPWLYNMGGIILSTYDNVEQSNLFFENSYRTILESGPLNELNSVLPNLINNGVQQKDTEMGV